MWNNVKAKVMGLKILHGFCNYCTQRHASVGVWVKRTPEKHRRCGQVHGKTRLFATRNYLSTEPPWRVLFFGTDDFAVESLKLLSASRNSNDRVVESLEVVTLSNDVPVKKFADQNKLPVHVWPLGDLQGRFDVGVVVSFGCLLREGLINQFPCGILNVHPSLLPRWRGPAPVFHTILHGDTITGVSVMQIRPKRFDVGPILHQEIYQVPDNFTADQLGATLATKGAQLLIDTLRTLPERITNRREQAQDGATLAPKISTLMSWIVWEEQTCVQIDCLFRAIASRIPLRTIWMGKTIKLLDFTGKCNISLSGRGRIPVPGSMSYQKESNTLAVCCKDGWVGFKAVMLKKRLSAADFYNGYLHQSFQNRSGPPKQECLFHSNRDRTGLQSAGENSLTQLHAVH
ncbi:methionyl-tRNA formyltransferase, mitochondrial [Oncorhynchus tshawytscha]|uniref:Methionyl-tRNA formyltransferase, mitochondrial n=1 Tax=Oncorhynchus tshawytscha TaxID=74940 RepID=A0AAZ3RGS9_ONCTS|nr:methionyl-tRNA formyltransferase, mitochondrial [Oncorhynchus tshawytscha]